MHDPSKSLPGKQIDIHMEVYTLRVEFDNFIKAFEKNFVSKGCVHVRLTKLWVYFLSLSNSAIFCFLLYLVIFKLK